MNYPDEDYVRFYTRDTITWLALEYEGQAILSLMLHGRFNRSGIFDCGGHDPSHAVTLATRCPQDVAKVGLKRLLDTGTWVLNNGKIIWPQYVLAQTCKRSDRSRKRESRENLANEAMGNPSHAVTRGHTRSHAVTPKPKPKQKPKPKPKPKGRESPPPETESAPEAVPTLTLDRSAAPPPLPLTLQAKAALWLRDKTRATLEAPSPESWPEVLELDNRLADLFGHTRRIKITSIKDPRVSKPLELWAAGIEQQDLLDALEGAASEDWVRKKPGLQTATWLFEDAERVQEFARKKPASEPKTAMRPSPRKRDPDEDFLDAQAKERNAAARANATPEELARAEGTAQAVTRMAGNLFKP